MSHLQESIEVEAPVERVYAVWAAFERYPEFMADVHEVRPLAAGRLAWRGRVGGAERAWEAEIVEQTPNRRIAWRSLGEPEIAEAVALTPAGEGRTRVTLSRDIAPRGAEEGQAASPAGLRSSLERFKRHVEQTGAINTSAPSVRSVLASDDDPRPNPGMAAPGAVTTPPSPAPPGFTGARGRGSAPPHGAGVSQQGGGTGGMGGDGSLGDDTGTGGSSAGLGLGAAGATAGSPRDEHGRSGDAPAPVAGGVAVNQGRGSDLGSTGEPLEGGEASLSGGSFGGSHESDVGAGLSNGMRSAHGPDASGGMGSSDDNQPGQPQGQTPPPAKPRATRGEKRRRKR